MTKSQIRPPRTPVGESMKVTIANQERIINDLIERITVLAKERDEAQRELRSVIDLSAKWAVEIESHKAVGEELCDRIDEMEKAHIRLQGWQDCAREIFDRIGTE